MKCSNNSTKQNTCIENNIAEVLLQQYWYGIIPRLCMNRFYPASAVQIVSQNTWRDILGPSALGRILIIQHSSIVIEYYCSMTSSRNHMTAEAACQAISEFINRFDCNIVEPYILKLLNILIICLYDTRWPVRDSAIIGSSYIIHLSLIHI